MPISAKLPRIAGIVACLIGGLLCISALLGPIAALPLAVIPLIGGVGILRRRVWSAYGLALYSFAQLIVVALLVLFRAGNEGPGARELVASVLVTCVFGSLFVLAGRSLRQTGAARGRALPWILVSVLFTLPFLFIRAFAMPSGSMQNTLLIGDRFLVQRFPKHAPALGELIVFALPVDRNQLSVKRVIGLPGDRIRIMGGVVYRNGIALEEPYAIHKAGLQNSYADNFPSEPDPAVAAAGQEMLAKHVANGEVVVPEASCFVLGDNRTLSLDSRYWGFVGYGDLIGQPLLIYDSENQPADQPASARLSRWERTRWGRLFKIL
jgi:signal peptidase I